MPHEKNVKLRPPVWANTALRLPQIRLFYHDGVGDEEQREGADDALLAPAEVIAQEKRAGVGSSSSSSNSSSSAAAATVSLLHTVAGNHYTVMFVSAEDAGAADSAPAAPCHGKGRKKGQRPRPKKSRQQSLARGLCGCGANDRQPAIDDSGP